MINLRNITRKIKQEYFTQNLTETTKVFIDCSLNHETHETGVWCITFMYSAFIRLCTPLQKATAAV